MYFAKSLLFFFASLLALPVSSQQHSVYTLPRVNCVIKLKLFTVTLLISHFCRSVIPVLPPPPHATTQRVSMRLWTLFNVCSKSPCAFYSICCTTFSHRFSRFYLNGKFIPANKILWSQFSIIMKPSDSTKFHANCIPLFCLFVNFSSNSFTIWVTVAVKSHLLICYEICQPMCIINRTYCT